MFRLIFRAGIGLGLVKTLLVRPSTIVIATARNEASAKSLREALDAAPKGAESGYFTFILDLGALASPASIRERLPVETNGAIKRIDVFISNAGHASSMGPALNTTAQELRSHFEANSIGPLVLFQAFWPLMERPGGVSTTGPPKVFMISSSVGSIEAQEPLPGGAYGPSKAALNWITRRLHFEFDQAGLVSVGVHPG